MTTKKQRDLDADWIKLTKKWETTPRFSRSGRGTAIAVKTEQTQRQTGARILSRTSPGGNTSLPKPKVYTGTAIIGIAVMHKSNLVPVFSKESAEDISKMRRN